MLLTRHDNSPKASISSVIAWPSALLMEREVRGSLWGGWGAAGNHKQHG